MVTLLSHFTVQVHPWLLTRLDCTGGRYPQQYHADTDDRWQRIYGESHQIAVTVAADAMHRMVDRLVELEQGMLRQNSQHCDAVSQLNALPAGGTLREKGAQSDTRGLGKPDEFD